VEVAIRDEFGWCRADSGEVRVWAKGYGANLDAFTKQLSDVNQIDPAALETLLRDVTGFFAIAAQGPNWAFAAVDRVRSIPLAFAASPDGWRVDDQAARLRNSLDLSISNPGAALAVGMAGYSIDTATLFKGIEQLGPGEFVLFRHKEHPSRHRYHTYRPWRADKPAYNPPHAEKNLREMTLSVIESMFEGLDGRMLVVPLSAGRDSRLIVSAAHHLGYKNVRTFAYGHAGNHEAETSKAIAERLGFEWRFVATDAGFMRRYFQSRDWSAYIEFADSLQSAPFVQDLPQIRTLKNVGYVPGDAVFCNGNSGDYISGAHVVPAIHQTPVDMGEESRWRRITGAIYDKHFALWQSLRIDTHREEIETRLRASILRAGGVLDGPTDDYGLYEYAEFQDRQCKFVITGQRIYEFLGHDWRLPLWDRTYLDFFEMVRLTGKIRQKLYADMLTNANWGGVWRDVPINRKRIRPNWIRPLRFAAKAAHVPLGKAAWHRFERRYFQYWMELGGHSTVRPYRTVRRDQRGARHGVAWLTENYLGRHGLAYDGTPIRNV